MGRKRKDDPTRLIRGREIEVNGTSVMFHYNDKKKTWGFQFKKDAYDGFSSMNSAIAGYREIVE